MSPVLAGILVFVVLATLVLRALLLWVSCKLCKARHVNAGQETPVGLLAASGVAVAAHVLAGLAIVLAFLVPGGGMAIVWLAFAALLPLLLVPFMLRLRFGRGLAAALVWYGFTLLAFAPIAGVLGFAGGQAFIIPTGAMAETLDGYHKQVKCPTCGHEFDINCSLEVDPDPGRPPSRVDRCTCPNCRRQIRLLRQDVDLRGPRDGVQKEAGDEYVETADPGPMSGDRVYVSRRWLQPSDFPQRMDIVVFRYPEDEKINYVKRLVGLPGETIAIHGGDLYRLAPEDGPKYDDSAVPAEERRKREHTHENDEAVSKLWEQGKFTILRKTPEQVLSRMLLVYDNDHPANDLKDKKWQRWQSEGDWEALEDGKSFRGTGQLRYEHRLRGETARPTLVTDFMAYNASLFGTSGANWVGDLVLECEVTVEKADGSLTLELVRAGERFQAKWDLGSDDGHCTLSRVDAKGSTETLGDAATELRKGVYRLRLANVDRQLTVWVDHALPFGDGISYPPPSEQGPTRLDLAPATIHVAGAAVSVQHLKLFRDGYYTLEPGGVNPPEVDWGDPRSWQALRELKIKTLYVQPGHYLCLGDNSAASSDGRSWGLVPERHLLGKVEFVYYPFQRARRPR